MAGLKFEIQVRTVLQHAWAELAHDRSFKFAPGLPSQIQRKLNLYSGLLEIVDSAFDAIAKEIDDYSVSIQSSSLDELTKVELSSISLERYVESVEQRFGVSFRKMPIEDDILEELRHFGIATIGDLEAIAPEEYIRLSEECDISETNYGFLRGAMMYRDIEKYFRGPVNWAAMSEKDLALLLRRYDRQTLDRIFEEHDIDIHDEG